MSLPLISFRSSVVVLPHMSCSLPSTSSSSHSSSSSSPSNASLHCPSHLPPPPPSLSLSHYLPCGETNSSSLSIISVYLLAWCGKAVFSVWVTIIKNKQLLSLKNSYMQAVIYVSHSVSYTTDCLFFSFLSRYTESPVK